MSSIKGDALMGYRNKTYVCFDGDNDIHYYRLMCAWKQNDNSAFDFYNAHDLNSARDSSQEENIKAQLRERLKNSSTLVVLIGEQTRYLHKFVRWEMEQALKLGLAVIGVNLNGRRSQDSERCPPVIRDELAVYVSYNPAIMQFALENWPTSHQQYKQEGKAGPFYYNDSIYQRAGI